MANLPDDVNVHDSDPPEQKFWTGRVFGDATICDSELITEAHACETEEDANDKAAGIIGKRAAERNPGCDVCHIEICQSEPD